MAEVMLEQVSKDYDGVTVLQPTSLSIADGEFLTLLGPSGCGKTTLLRMVAGFNQPTRGRVRIDGEDVTDVPPQKREIGMVFQDYALFPHMTVAENIGFGLVERGVARAQVERRVRELLELIRLPEVGHRYPAEVSGGQQQRIAVARAVAHPPRVLLMDEPLGALDLKMREVMQLELRRIQQALGITTVYVTHDQTEAMTMSDRIVVMNKGRIEQMGSALDIYRRPASRFAADFVGRINLLDGTVTASPDAATLQVQLPDTVAHVTHDADASLRLAAGRAVCLGVRPEHLQILPAASTALPNRMQGVVRSCMFVGNQWNVVVGVAGGAEWTVEVRSMDPACAVGMPVLLGWSAEHSIALVH